MKTFSLTRRLIGAVLLVELCSTVLLVAGAGVYESLSHFHAFDVMLRGRADSLVGAVQDAEDPQDNVMLDGTQTSAPKRDVYAVRDELGRVLGKSANWPDAEAAFADERAFRGVMVGGRRYRVVRVPGLRMVDPGDRGGGIPRRFVVLYGAPTYPVWRMIRQTMMVYAGLSVAVLWLSGLVMLRLLRRGLAPLHELAAEAAGVSTEAWGFRPSARVRQVRELAPLAGAIETALAGLERSFEQQRQFVGDAAHELKTSVAVVKSSLQVLTMRVRSAEEYRVGMERVERDCERMEELVGKMLMLAVVEAGAGVAAADEVELRGVMVEVVEHLRTTAEMGDVRVAFSGDAEVWVRGEREKVRLLGSNLVSNAVHYSGRGGEVRVCVREAAGRAEMRVEDDGEGIAVEALPRVFDRFYRGDQSRSRRTGGTGLGLAIARAIVVGMGGEIGIRSEPGRGTAVVVELPMSVPSSEIKVGLPY